MSLSLDISDASESVFLSWPTHALWLNVTKYEEFFFEGVPNTLLQHKKKFLYQNHFETRYPRYIVHYTYPRHN